jgi:hypothetical protein
MAVSEPEEVMPGALGFDLVPGQPLGIGGDAAASIRLRDARPRYADLAALEDGNVRARCFSRSRGLWIFSPGPGLLTTNTMLHGLRAEHLWRALPAPRLKGQRELWLRTKDFVGSVDRSLFVWLSASDRGPAEHVTPTPCVILLSGCQIWIEDLEVSSRVWADSTAAAAHFSSIAHGKLVAGPKARPPVSAAVNLEELAKSLSGVLVSLDSGKVAIERGTIGEGVWWSRGDRPSDPLEATSLAKEIERLDPASNGLTEQPLVLFETTAGQVVPFAIYTWIQDDRTRALVHPLERSQGTTAGDEIKKRIEALSQRPKGAVTGVIQKRPKGAVLRRFGAGWETTFAGQTVWLQNRKGIAYIAYLLGHPGEKVGATDLRRAVDGYEEPEAQAQPAIDDRAKAELRARRRKLELEIEEADSDQDIGRRERAQEELESLDAYLMSVLGLGGKARPVGAGYERARKAVSKAIGEAIAKIKDAHPALAEHLDSSIHSGNWLSYEPKTPVEWQIEG